MNHNKCPSCNEEIKEIDTLGMFSFETKSSRLRWVVGFGFLIVVWSIIIPIVVPNNYSTFLLLIYYALAYSLLYRLYKKKFNTIIYECEGCNDKFIGVKLKKFTYSHTIK